MASIKVLDAAAKGVSSGPQVIGSTGFVLRCATGSLDLVIEGEIYASIPALGAEVFTVSSGDTVEVISTGDGTTAWLGDL